MTTIDPISVKTSGNRTSDLSIDVDSKAGRISLTGELDIATAPLVLESALVLQRFRAGDLTVELGRLTFIDAAGLSAFVEIAKTQRQLTGEFRIAGLPQRLRRCFEAGRAEWLLADDLHEGAHR